MPKGELTAKQRVFVQEYLVDGNGTQAAIRAGYSQKTANEQAARLLANVSIASAIKEGLDKRAEKCETDANWVRERLKREAEFEGEGASHSARVSAVMGMAKINGMLLDKLEHSGAIDLGGVPKDKLQLIKTILEDKGA